MTTLVWVGLVYPTSGTCARRKAVSTAGKSRTKPIGGVHQVFIYIAVGGRYCAPPKIEGMPLFAMFGWF